jgi:hypothetical protein
VTSEPTVKIDQDDKLDLLAAILAAGTLNPGSDAHDAVDAFRSVRSRLVPVLRAGPAAEPVADAGDGSFSSGMHAAFEDAEA